MNELKCVAISDTHGMYGELKLPKGDVLIHAGDILGRGTFQELIDFNEWLGEQDFEHKIIIAGNHDWCFERDPEKSIEILSNGIYLKDSEIIIDGIKFYGTPYQPRFFNWAFNLNRGAELKSKWDLIPNDTDVLITHGPPLGITHEVLDVDRVMEGDSVGCFDLAEALKRVKPAFHICGHIHEGYGVYKIDDVTVINASTCTRRYAPTNKPIEFSVSRKH